MTLHWDEKVLLRKIEAAYATDPVPTGAADAANAYEVSITPLEADYVERRAIRPFIGNTATDLVANERVRVSYRLDATGAGAAGTVPKYGADLRMAGFAETISVGVDVQYSPVSDAQESGAVYFNLAGQRHKTLGCRANLQLDYTSGQIPRLMLDTLGLYAGPDDSALPAASFAGWQEPRVVDKDNTPIFTLHGFACVLRSLTINMNNVLAHRDWVNAKEVRLPDRNPTGQVVIEAPTVAQKNYFGIVLPAGGGAPAAGALQLVHGTAAGAIHQLDCGLVQLTNPRYSEQDKITLLTMDLKIIQSEAGNDDVLITVK